MIVVTYTGALMVADDLALTSHTLYDMQAALTIAECDASRERYKFNTDKIKIIPINCKQAPSLILKNKLLGSSDKEPHLGMQRMSNCRHS